MRWPPLLTPVTYLCKLLGIHAVAAFTQLELFRVYGTEGTTKTIMNLERIEVEDAKSCNHSGIGSTQDYFYRQRASCAAGDLG
nr:hypothetical protein B7L51_02300 [Pectobacterium carotovorum]